MRCLLPLLLAATGVFPTLPGLAAQVVPNPPKNLGWPGFGRLSTHDATAQYATQTMLGIRWQTPVDLAPQYSGTNLLIHYGSPLVTPNGTVIVTVKTGATGGFRVEGRISKSGTLLWTLPTNYVLPPHNWVPSVGSTLTPTNDLAVPASGGLVLLRGDADQVTAATQQLAFYGLANYTANPAAYDANVVINTPITCDSKGNLFFGFMVLGATPVPLQSGIARIDRNGSASWVSAATASGDGAIRKVVTNCAPAVSLDRTSLYVAVTSNATSGFGQGYLLKLDSTTLVQQARVRLRDVANPGNFAFVPDDGTSSPMIGPDGDVYYGVLENGFGSNNYRGWMLHFDGALAVTKTPGAFGWDSTAAVVPSSCVPSYAGASSYLILTKYNNYGGIGGDGLNRVAVLDPNTAAIEPVSGQSTMLPVLTVLGPTPDPNYPSGVREWCINTAAVDPARRSALVNSEDGKIYRWDFVTNTLIEPVVLTVGIGEAYTPTVVAPNGIVFAINNGILFALGS